MKSELTTVPLKENQPTPFPKLMKHKTHGTVVAATAKHGNAITGTCVWAKDEYKHKLLTYNESWNASALVDLPRNECIILSNQ